jgi:hypothetical protein
MFECFSTQRCVSTLTFGLVVGVGAEVPGAASFAAAASCSLNFRSLALRLLRAVVLESLEEVFEGATEAASSSISIE